MTALDFHSELMDLVEQEVMACIGCNDCMLACPLPETQLVTIGELNAAKSKVIQQTDILKKRQLAASKADTKEWKKQLAQLGREKLRLEFSGAESKDVELMQGKIKDLMEQMVDATNELAVDQCERLVLGRDIVVRSSSNQRNQHRVDDANQIL